MLFLPEGFIPFKGDALVEFGGAAFAFRDEVEADTTDVLLGTEVLEIVDFLALDFKFEQTEVLQAHLRRASVKSSCPQNCATTTTTN